MLRAETEEKKKIASSIAYVRQSEVAKRDVPGVNKTRDCASAHNSEYRRFNTHSRYRRCALAGKAVVSLIWVKGDLPRRARTIFLRGVASSIIILAGWGEVYGATARDRSVRFPLLGYFTRDVTGIGRIRCDATMTWNRDARLECASQIIN